MFSETFSQALPRRPVILRKTSQVQGAATVTAGRRYPASRYFRREPL